MRREQFYKKYNNSNISSSEIDRKYRQYLYEQEMMQLSRVFRIQSKSIASTILNDSEIEPFVDPDYVDDDYME